MNINPLSDDYGRIVPWDSLTAEQQQSGDWIKLPATDENGDVVQARRRRAVDDLASIFGPPKKFDESRLGIWTGGKR